jgi:hypothetical protein
LPTIKWLAASVGVIFSLSSAACIASQSFFSATTSSRSSFVVRRSSASFDLIPASAASFEAASATSYRWLASVSSAKAEANWPSDF